MCLLWPYQHLMIHFIIGSASFLSSVKASPVADDSNIWDVIFDPKEIDALSMENKRTVKFETSDLSDYEVINGRVSVISENLEIASVESKPNGYNIQEEIFGNRTWISSFNVTGNFLGHTKVHLYLYDYNKNLLRQSNALKVTVVRPTKIINEIFTYSVAALVAIIYVNFGCMLDWSLFKPTLKKPVGPVICFICQFLFMPLISFGLGKALFPDVPAMQLGMFFSGVSPGGGASNIWTLLLDGNVNLSITMTTISTFAAFAMMPLWIFSLGRVVFAEAQIAIPYYRIATFASGLVIPLCIGFLIQRYYPRVCKFMVKILKPFSAFLIVFIIVFAIATNLYLFKLFSWQIVIAGLGLPWLGFLSGLIMSSIFRQKVSDTVAIAVETGIQNTAIPIFMLRFSLGQPAADLTTVVPVAVAVMTPLPLIIVFCVNKLLSRRSKEKTLDLEKVGDKHKDNCEPLTNIPNS